MPVSWHYTVLYTPAKFNYTVYVKGSSGCMCICKWLTFRHRFRSSRHPFDSNKEKNLLIFNLFSARFAGIQLNSGVYAGRDKCLCQKSVVYWFQNTGWVLKQLFKDAPSFKNTAIIIRSINELFLCIFSFILFATVTYTRRVNIVLHRKKSRIVKWSCGREGNLTVIAVWVNMFENNTQRSRLPGYYPLYGWEMYWTSLSNYNF